MTELSQAATDVLAERRRQIEVEAYSPEHDDEHGNGELAMAAACYASPRLTYVREDCANEVRFVDPWPWSERDDRRAGNGNVILANSRLPRVKRRRQLVQAAALIIAEIERLDRENGNG